MRLLLSLLLLLVPAYGQTLLQQNWDIRNYQFRLVNGSGATASLGSPGAKTATLKPCPKGVNGTDLFHYLLISGGTGTAEAVRITGGTAGTSSCTVDFTTANSHSNSWAISSATAGTAEAAQMAVSAGGGIVFLPSGPFSFQAGVFIGTNGIKIRGAGRRATHITRDVAFPSFDVFKFFAEGGGTGNELSGMTIDLSAAAVDGYGVNAQNQSELALTDLEVGTPNGLRVVGDAYTVVRNVMIPSVAANSFGIYVSGGLDVVLENIFMGSANTASVATAGFAGLYLDGTSGFYAHDMDIIQLGKGVFVGAGGAQFTSMRSVYADTCFDHSWAISPVFPGRVVSFVCHDCWAATSVHDGVVLDSTLGRIYGFHWLGSRNYNNGKHGFELIGTNTKDTLIANSSISGNGRIVGDEIRVGAGVGSLDIVNNVIGMADAPPADSYWNPTATHGVGIDSDGGPGPGAADFIHITGNRFTGGYTSGALTNGASGAHVMIQNNSGIEDGGVWATIASAGVISLPTNGQNGFFITGTSTVITILGGSLNQKIRIVKRDAGDVVVGGVGAGSNIPTAFTLQSGNAHEWSFDGTKWY